MKHSRSVTIQAARRLLALFALLTCGALAADDECAAVGGYGFVCGPVNGE